MRNLLNISKASAVALAVGLLAGCATADNGDISSRLADVEKQAAAAQATANEANAKAEAAQNTANQAKEMASRAEGLARATQYNVDRLSKRQEQMFQKSMYK